MTANTPGQAEQLDSAEQTGPAARSDPAPRTASRKALRWEDHKERTRRQLVESARELFAERGFEATSAADIAAAAGVTERTLFRYFPSKIALVLDDVLAQLPEMFELIGERPAGEPPYQAVREGIIDFGQRHRDLLLLLIAGPEAALQLPVSARHPVPAGGAVAALQLPLGERQRTLIDFEDALADVLRRRYAVPPEDQITPAVWARASMGALRTALAVTAKNPPQVTDEATPIVDTVRACFAALEAPQNYYNS